MYQPKLYQVCRVSYYLYKMWPDQNIYNIIWYNFLRNIIYLHYRQTLIFSSVLMPQIKSVMNKKCHNYAGKVLVENPIEVGSIQQVLVQVPQIFHRYDFNTILFESFFVFFVSYSLTRLTFFCLVRWVMNSTTVPSMSFEDSINK